QNPGRADSGPLARRPRPAPGPQGRQPARGRQGRLGRQPSCSRVLLGRLESSSEAERREVGYGPPGADQGRQKTHGNRPKANARPVAAPPTSRAEPPDGSPGRSGRAGMALGPSHRQLGPREAPPHVFSQRDRQQCSKNSREQEGEPDLPGLSESKACGPGDETAYAQAEERDQQSPGDSLEASERAQNGDGGANNTESGSSDRARCPG